MNDTIHVQKVLLKSAYESLDKTLKSLDAVLDGLESLNKDLKKLDVAIEKSHEQQ